MDVPTGFLGLLLSVAFGGALIVLAVLWGAYVAATLWGWYVVPLGVPTIGYWHAVGIECVLGAFGLLGRRSRSDDVRSGWRGLFDAAGYPFFMPLLFLAVGAIARLHI
jgi:hypothetical protein